jgi:hypothetical protein
MLQHTTIHLLLHHLFFLQLSKNFRDKMSDLDTETTIVDASVAEALIPEQIEEGQEAYRLGGFHPVRIGELYNGQYKVLRKLGYGSYSTVWLVQSESYVAQISERVLSQC